MRRRAQAGERGQVVPITALAMVALLAFVGFAVDTGQLMYKHRKAQNAADAAALAASFQLAQGQTESTATTAATTAAVQNGFAAGELTLAYLDSSGASTTVAANVTKVKAWVGTSFPTAFIRVVGIRTSTVKSNATASVTWVPPCVLCVLNPHASMALNDGGNGGIDVTNGGVVVDSDANDAAFIGGSGSIAATSIGVVGNYYDNNKGAVKCPPANNPKGFCPTPTTGVTPVPDPLAGVPVPSVPGTSNGDVTGGDSSPVHFQPGIYSSITAKNADIVLDANPDGSPGIYVITGSMNITANGNITGSNVMVYFACASYPTPCSLANPPVPQPGAYLYMHANGSYQVSPPTSGPWKGMALFFDRYNKGGSNNFTVDIGANGSIPSSGTIYSRSGTLNLSGDGSTQRSNSLVVTDKVLLQGNGGITLTFDKNNNYVVPGGHALID